MCLSKIRCDQTKTDFSGVNADCKKIQFVSDVGYKRPYDLRIFWVDIAYVGEPGCKTVRAVDNRFANGFGNAFQHALEYQLMKRIKDIPIY